MPLKNWRRVQLAFLFYFLENVQGKTKKATEHHQLHDVLGHCMATVIDRTTFHICRWCRKTAILAVISRGFGLILKAKASVTSDVSSKGKRELKLQKQCKPCDDFWVRGHEPRQFHCSHLLNMVPGQWKGWPIFFKNSKWVYDPPPSEHG